MDGWRWCTRQAVLGTGQEPWVGRSTPQPCAGTWMCSDSPWQCRPRTSGSWRQLDRHGLVVEVQGNEQLRRGPVRRWMRKDAHVRALRAGSGHAEIVPDRRVSGRTAADLRLRRELATGIERAWSQSGSAPDKGSDCSLECTGAVTCCRVDSSRSLDAGSLSCGRRTAQAPRSGPSVRRDEGVEPNSTRTLRVRRRSAGFTAWPDRGRDEARARREESLNRHGGPAGSRGRGRPAA